MRERRHLAQRTQVRRTPSLVRSPQTRIPEAEPWILHRHALHHTRSYLYSRVDYLDGLLGYDDINQIDGGLYDMMQLRCSNSMEIQRTNNTVLVIIRPPRTATQAEGDQ